MPPQCAQVNFCAFTMAVRQRFSSIVRPVSVSFAVEGQRTRRLLMLGPLFTLGRRGGSKRNLVAISESINDARLGGIVWGHLHFYSITDRKANETFAHFAGDMRKNEMVVRKRDAKHGPGKHRHDGALYCDRFFRIYHVHLRVALANSAAPKLRGRAAQSIPPFTGENQRRDAARPEGADVVRADALRSQLVRGH